MYTIDLKWYQMNKIRSVFYSTLLGGSMTVFLSLVLSFFSLDVANRFLEEGWTYTFYLFVYFQPVLFVLFYITSFLIEITQRFEYVIKIPLILVPFGFLSFVFIVFSFDESYMRRVDTYALLFLVSFLFAFCSMPLIKYYQADREIHKK